MIKTMAEITDRRYMECFEAVRALVHGHRENIKEISRLKADLAGFSDSEYDSLSARVFTQAPKQRGKSDPVYRAYAFSEAREENIKATKRRIAYIYKKLKWEKSLLAELPENQKQAIKLKWHDGLSWPEASGALNISERHAMRLGALGLHHMALSVYEQRFERAKDQPQP